MKTDRINVRDDFDVVVGIYTKPPSHPKAAASRRTPK
jgi:hypothetical protein